MSIEERKNSIQKSNIIQNLILESREKLNITHFNIPYKKT